MKFTNIKQIAAHQFKGNHASDAAAFNAIDAFVLDAKNSLADRAEALRIQSDEGMGMGRCEQLSDQQLLSITIDGIGSEDDMSALSKAIAKTNTSRPLANTDMAFEYIKGIAGVKRREVHYVSSEPCKIVFTLHQLASNHRIADAEELVTNIMHTTGIVPQCSARKIQVIAIQKWVTTRTWQLGGGRQIVLTFKDEIELTLVHN